ncbi:hypothetical protein FPF71_01085 [Algibacter amylolyticus]|uniref:Outer membrane lipoprotein-sorting protein n=1 Tax=Algibacter amylolyticus TaxID=1608400 RepID=A0A5M7BG75_9FLAO|nr:hypothetical protein [Algibacter amylolyticus]KAA5827467.1 hypothetical protein F2B50_01085 [Algibacter amylolyticus]MBB5266664.1 hypothetical protein [Algibacter amylolyticus]TSJ81712.1 hypothetical protein FPF71_01085 [Algibacter amylolyticus]
MKNILLTLTLGASIFATSCKNNTEAKTESTTVETATKDLALKPESWINARVEKAKTKLQSTEAGNIIWQAMEAHGGLKNWYSNGPVSFHFDYLPLDGKTRRNTHQTIDTWSNKARHQSLTDSTDEFGWTGEKAWKKTKDSLAFPFDMRFWALTPHYFLSQPFVFDGEGVNFKKLEDKTHKNETFNTVKVTFSPGTGDAPDDYYILYFSKTTHKLAVIRYIVSYPEYFKNGKMKHSPEKFMEIQGYQTVSGIEFPTAYHTHWLTKNETAGAHITTITVDNISFKPELENDYFDMPNGAVLIE